jgi:hypothetical protein
MEEELYRGNFSGLTKVSKARKLKKKSGGKFYAKF